ncbi:MAG: helix-turn-helix transcriptional regulator [Erysipelotrichaceae bacterium]|nr:helix-turn-helix transcriptional regulator [Erysipelotrichaceae bacterium]
MKKSSKRNEEKILKELLKDSKAKKAYEAFDDEYNVRMMLIKARKKENITQKELSDITGLSQQMISRVETGSTDTTLKTLMKYLKGIGYDIRLSKINY